MNYRTWVCWFLVYNSLYFAPGCATTIKQNITDDETITGSDWSAKDLKEVSEYMDGSISRAAFIKDPQYIEQNPRWILARDLRNDTDEHVNTRIIMEKIRYKTDQCWICQIH